jgi:diadenosine tetraphosphate (Ap4A) HIT family hydrolase
MIGNNYSLWDNDTFIVKTPFNPHTPYSEGLHIIVAPKADITSAWEDPELSGEAFKLAAKVSQVITDLGMAPWLNLQANGNWGLLPGATPFFHIHIYGRNKTDSWGKPITLPELPKTYHNAPMPEADRELLARTLSESLQK